MFDARDLRSTLTATATATATTTAPDTGIAAPEFFEFHELAPAEVAPGGSQTWFVRGQNLVIGYTWLRAGDRLARDAQPHEYLVLFPDAEAAVRVAAGPDERTVRGAAVAIVPPGASAITADEDTAVVRVFDVRSTDLVERSANAGSYRDPHPRVAPLVPWPDPVDGHRLRVYLTADHPRSPDRFGRIFRSSSLMVNFGDPVDGPRDTSRLSPHHHDDFEQFSLVVKGKYVHHIRTPWSTRLAEWRDDEHRTVGSPSVTIIPPPTQHTSQAVGGGMNHLIDVFSPPRADFSAKPGWVINADEYPAP